MHFLDFSLEDNYLVPVRTFAIFSAAHILSALFRFSTNIYSCKICYHQYFSVTYFSTFLTSRKLSRLDINILISTYLSALATLSATTLSPQRTFFVNSLVADIFLNFWLQDNNLVPVWTFDRNIYGSTYFICVIFVTCHYFIIARILLFSTF